MITTNSKNVLLADDSVFFRTKLSAILIEAGHKIWFASDGNEVIKSIEEGTEKVDLLILDLQMPNVDGFAVLEWISKSRFSGTFPILVVTGVYEPDEVVERLQKLGAKGLMSKGFTPEQVLYRVNMLLFPDMAVTRANGRVPISVPVDFTLTDESYTGFILNISTSGLFLHTRMDMLPGSEIELKFLIPTATKVITAKTTVAWATPSSATKSLFGGAGLKFTKISNEDGELIREYVNDEIKKMHLY